jgi:hypothetical protein
MQVRCAKAKSWLGLEEKNTVIVARRAGEVWCGRLLTVVAVKAAIDAR